MGTDIFRSRRGYNEPCRWWARNEGEQYDNDILVMKKAPTGAFMAKEIYTEVEQNNIVAGAFMFERTTVSIKSPDNLNGIKVNDLVEYQGQIWRVINVSKKYLRSQQREFATDENMSCDWLLDLRR